MGVELFLGVSCHWNSLVINKISFNFKDTMWTSGDTSAKVTLSDLRMFHATVAACVHTGEAGTDVYVGACIGLSDALVH